MTNSQIEVWDRLQKTDVPLAERILRHAANYPNQPLYMSREYFTTEMMITPYNAELFFNVNRNATTTTLFGVEIVFE